MHVQTHILSGWCVANCLPCTPRQRLLAMIAASAADMDGISILFGQEAYWTYHHTFGHNVFTAVALSCAMAAFTPGRRLASFAMFVCLFHLHLLMDYYGSGPGWHIHYLWPLKAMTIRNPHAWPFYSWQNMLVFLGFLFWTVGIAWRKKRTPLECIMPKLDAQLVGLRV
jgi:hypothetical protein